MLDIGVGVNDRRLDEGWVLALQELVEIGTHGTARARVAERVTGGAAVGCKDLLAGREVLPGSAAAGGAAAARGGSAGARGLLGEPAVEVCDRHDVRGLAHEGVAEPAQLGADDRIG